MFGLGKLYNKWRFKSLVLTKLNHCIEQKSKYSSRIDEWKFKVFDEGSRCLTKEMFEKNRQQQLQFSADMYKHWCAKIEVLQEILIDINEIENG